MTKKQQLILASSSPRRISLLKEANYDFEVIPSDIDEESYLCEGMSPRDHAVALAKAKAYSVAERYPKRLVLGSDCLADVDGEIVGKPEDAEHAEDIIRKLFSKPHRVITAVAIVCVDRGVEEVFSDTTIIYPKEITQDQISRYIKTRKWEGKAGAYGIQDNKFDFVDRIEGSFTNVVGLPMEKTVEVLDRLLK